MVSQEENHASAPRSGAEEFLREAERCFQGTLEQSQFRLGDAGFFEAACVFNPPLSGNMSDNLLDRVMAVHPALVDWPLWVDTRRRNLRELHPHLELGGVECRVTGGKYSVALPQFWRIEPTCLFFVEAVFEEDTVDRASTPVLDSAWRIRRVIDAIKYCLAFAKELGAGSDTRLEFAFRWTRLQGRVLRYAVPWGELGKMSSQSDHVLSQTALPVPAGRKEILDAAERALAPLLGLFDATVPPREWLENWCQDF
ncbi:MAG: hypothetical protein PHP75_05490 [Methylacidiphilaceae bacterium]|nr:hypothetical protein [Candidatus Methylacidiphilaceae bacterium]